MAYFAPMYINDIVDSFLRGGTYTGAISGLPSSLYLALLKAPPYSTGDTNLYFDYDTEVTYTGYARRTIPRSLTGFLGTQGTTAISSGSSGATRPATSQYFPLCTTSSEIVTHAALVIHSARYDTQNQVLCYWTLDKPMPLSATAPGFYPCLFAAGLTVQLDD